MERPRVLLTGFGPFPGVTENPSAWLAETVGASRQNEDCTLYRAVFPTEWEAVASRADYFYKAIKPRLIIHFGVQVKAAELRLEQQAHNEVDSRPDALGALPERAHVLPDCSPTLETFLPVDALAARLQEEHIPSIVSRSCGRYLCNDLYFRSLNWAEQNGADALFVHVPHTRTQGGPVNSATLLLAAEAILSEAIQAVHLQSKFTADSPGGLPFE